jgi:glucose/arabinose dehydrogenase
MTQPRLAALLAASLLAPQLGPPARAQGPALPPGFASDLVASGFIKPVAIAFVPDGRLFVAEQRGMVWVVAAGSTLAEPFIDLRGEVNGQNDHGLLGLALDPDFASSRNVYLLYAVDPIPGAPDEPFTTGSFGRLTRYTGTPQSNGNVADPDSRTVLLGASAADGIPVCQNHTVGALRFGLDGSLFASAGDGAHFDIVDAGNADPECFTPGMFGPDQNIGAFRAQYLDSLAGKILRLDPATGLGLPTNPYWTGSGADHRSRIWVSGLRNPYRFALLPDSPPPGALCVADVGWSLFEEINFASGGENFGWPCYEGSSPAIGYPAAIPAHSGCDSIGTDDNPGPLRGPFFEYHHSNGALSSLPGLLGLAVSGIAVYDGVSYPIKYRGACFFADYLGGPSANGWITMARADAQGQLAAAETFATMVGRAVDLAIDPVGGDLVTVSLLTGEIRRLRYDPNLLADITGDGAVDVADLVELITHWGPCPPAPAGCASDLDGSGAVDPPDLIVLLFNWD